MSRWDTSQYPEPILGTNWGFRTFNLGDRGPREPCGQTPLKKGRKSLVTKNILKPPPPPSISTCSENSSGCMPITHY